MRLANIGLGKMRYYLLIASAAVAAAVVVAPAETAARDYYEWSTRRPFSGWVWGGGRRSYYCDYIRYPVRECRPRKICHKGKCRTEERCRVVDWDIRQTCY